MFYPVNINEECCIIHLLVDDHFAHLSQCAVSRTEEDLGFASCQISFLSLIRFMHIDEKSIKTTPSDQIIGISNESICLSEQKKKESKDDIVSILSNE